MKEIPNSYLGEHNKWGGKMKTERNIPLMLTALELKILHASLALSTAIRAKEEAMRAEYECETLISKITTTHVIGPEIGAVKRARYDLELLIRQLC